jgi:hypothetical protein
MNDEFALDLVANGATMTAAGDVDMLLSPINAVVAASVRDRLGDWRFNDAMALPLRLTVA